MPASRNCGRGADVDLVAAHGTVLTVHNSRLCGLMAAACGLRWP
jgi:hypothetical protein